MTRVFSCKTGCTPVALLSALALMCSGWQAQAQSTPDAPTYTTNGSTLTISGGTGQFSSGTITDSSTLILTTDSMIIGSSTVTLSNGTGLTLGNTAFNGANSYTGATSVLSLNTGTTGGTLVLNGTTVSDTTAITLNGTTTNSVSLLNSSGQTSGGSITLNNGSGSLNLYIGTVLTVGTTTYTTIGTTTQVTPPSGGTIILGSGGTLYLTGLSGSGIAVHLGSAGDLGSIQLGTSGVSISFTNSGTAQSGTTVCVAALGSVPTGNAPTSASFAAPTVSLLGMGNLGGQSIAERGVVFSQSATSTSPALGGTGVIKIVHTGNPDSTGGFSLTTSGLAANTQYSYRVYATDTTGATTFSQPLSFTTPTVLQNWRQTFFGSIAGTGHGADNADPDGDGVPNLIEFATGKDPTTASPAGTAVSYDSSSLDYRYTRSLDALNSGVTFSVEWNDTLNASQWSSADVSETILSDDGLIQQVKAAVPAGSSGRRFVRLKVLPPSQ
jgi:hypothetical protein